MPPTATGSLTINEGAGPFHYGDTLTFTTSSSNLRGGHEMVEVAFYQDTDGDGLEMDLFGSDLVGLTLNPPAQAVSLPPAGSTDTSQVAKGWARLLNYNRKGQQQTIDELDRVEFEVGP